MLHLSRTAFLVLLGFELGLGGIVVAKLLIEGSTGRALTLAAVLAVAAIMLWISRLASIERDRRQTGTPPPDPR